MGWHLFTIARMPIIIIQFASLRKQKLCDARERFDERNGGVSRFSAVSKDYSNIEAWATHQKRYDVIHTTLLQ